LKTIAPEVTTLSSVAALITGTLRSRNIDPTPLLVHAGIAADTVGKQDTRIPTVRMQALWQLAVEASGDPAFGLAVAREFQPAVMHGLGFACLASDTLRDVLGRLVRFSRILNTLPDFQLQENDRSIDLLVTIPNLGPEFIHAATDMGMAAFLRLCQLSAGHELMPVYTSLQRPAPEDPAAYHAVFGPHVDFESESNRLSFDRAQALAPLLTAHPELARLNDQTVIDYLARFDHDNITMQVRSKIIEQLPDGRPSQGDIANELNTSLRSLQRKLHNRDTSYKELLNNTQHELALFYMRDSSRSIGEITYLLGFSEPSNFTRAFKRWTGKSPGEYREAA
jgi:AraC-like DNA-binding protein